MIRTAMFMAALAGALASPAFADELTVERAVELALERNPELASAAADVRAARARLSGAELPFQSNPELAAGAGPRNARGERTVDVEVEVAQRVELFGQRGARIDVANSEHAAAESRLAARRVAVAAEVRIAFAEALAADRLAALAREDLALTREAASAAARRAELGGASRLEVNAVRAEVGRAARGVSVATRRASAARAALRAVAGIEPAVDLALAGALGARSEGPPATAVAPLVARALEKRPDVAAARREVDAARAEARLATREVLPAPELAVQYAREEGANVVLGVVAFDLPVWNRNPAGRGVASARLSRAEAELAATLRRAQLDVALAVDRLSAATEAAQAFADEALAGAEENASLATRAFEAGKIGLAELLLIRRSALDARRDHVEALVDLAAAEAELARAVGTERLLVGGET